MTRPAEDTIDLVRQAVVREADTLVVKIGTNVLTDAAGRLDLPHLRHLVDQLAHIRLSGRRLVLVSSGAVGAGLSRLGLDRRPPGLSRVQAAAAVGQGQLIALYDRHLADYGLGAAQILLTNEDFHDRGRYLNVRNTLRELFRWPVIPVLNENDTISTEEIRFSDNDRLAALVAGAIDASLLVILSNVPGLYGGDFGRPDAKPLDVVSDITPDVRALGRRSTSPLGTGGMAAKLRAAQKATVAGSNVWLVDGRRRDVLADVLAGRRVGTLFPMVGRPPNARKRWLAQARPSGQLRLDPGACRALARGKSLLPVGVVEVAGDFAAGDVVALLHEDQGAWTLCGQGLVNYSAAEARRLIGLSSGQIAEVLPGNRHDELIHRDNLTFG